MSPSVAVLFLNAEKDIKGGGEFYLRDAVKIIVTCFKTFCGVPSEGGASECLRDLGAEIVVIDPAWSRKLNYLGRNYFRLWKAAWDLRDQNIRVVYANAGHIGPFAIRLARLLRARCVVHVHDIFEEGSQEKFLFVKADKVLVCSRYLANKITGCEAEVLYNGVDINLFTPKLKILLDPRKDTERDSFIVGIMGTVNRKKGFFEFVRMAGLLAKRAPRIKFVAIGSPKPGEESVLDSLNAEVAALGLQERFLWRGFSATPQLDLASLDVLVMPSRYEAFGRVITEAFACGVPVVATRSGGPDEIIEDGQSGLLRAVDDIEGLAEAVYCLYSDSSFRERIVNMAYNEAINRFSLDKMADNLKRIVGLLSVDVKKDVPGSKRGNNAGWF